MLGANVGSNQNEVKKSACRIPGGLPGRGPRAGPVIWRSWRPRSQNLSPRIGAPTIVRPPGGDGSIGGATPSRTTMADSPFTPAFALETPTVHGRPDLGWLA